MSTEEKVELVAEVKDRHGLNKFLQAVELPKLTWYYWREEKQAYVAKYEHSSGVPSSGWSLGD